MTNYPIYVQRLAREEGLETSEGAALRNFDRHRAGKKMSNEQWQNPHDPDAKIRRTKDGATDMVVSRFFRTFSLVAEEGWMVV